MATLHVDILKNDWVDGVQRRIARLYINGDGVEVDMADDARSWKQKLLHPIADPATGEMLDPATAPKDFLRALVHDMSGGAYLVAVGPHDSHACPVADDGTVSPAS